MIPAAAAIAAFMPPLAWISLGGALLTVADIAFRSWQESNWAAGFAACFAIYMVGIFCMMMSFMGQNIAVATVATVLFNVVTYLAAAYFLWGETISTTQMAGIALGFVAIALLELG